MSNDIAVVPFLSDSIQLTDNVNRVKIIVENEKGRAIANYSRTDYSNTKSELYMNNNIPKNEEPAEFNRLKKNGFSVRDIADARGRSTSYVYSKLREYKNAK